MVGRKVQSLLECFGICGAISEGLPRVSETCIVSSASAPTRRAIAGEAEPAYGRLGEEGFTASASISLASAGLAPPKRRVAAASSCAENGTAVRVARYRTSGRETGTAGFSASRLKRLAVSAAANAAANTETTAATYGAAKRAAKKGAPRRSEPSKIAQARYEARRLAIGACFGAVGIATAATRSERRPIERIFSLEVTEQSPPDRAQGWFLAEAQGCFW